MQGELLWPLALDGSGAQAIITEIMFANIYGGLV